jgi:acetyl-CoA synthetase
VDDVINVSGHRLSTADVEAALLQHSAVAEMAVIGVQDHFTGQAINALVSLKPGNDVVETPHTEFKAQMRKEIGPFATPKAIFILDDLPKTRSGKIMRRIL